MKHIILSLLTITALAHAETTVTMTGVHNCCKSCTNGIVKAGTSAGKDITVTAEGKTVTITTKKKTDAKKAVEAIIAAGYYGSVEGEESTASKTASKPEGKLTKATVTGVHLCCKKCADAAIAAVKTVTGITSNDIVAKSESFTVEGDFTKAELTAALNAAGFAGEIK